MSEELKDPAAPAEEYTKPNPQENPRNIALAEIAGAVAKQHETEFKESFPSINDEGEITPPPGAEPPLSEPAPAAAESEASPVAAEPALAAPAAPSPLDPEALYDVVVDGQKLSVKGKAIIDAGFRTFQKETAADFRLKMASELLREAEAKAQPRGEPAALEAPPAGEKTDAELGQALQYGTPEQVAEAVKILRGRGAVSTEQLQAFTAQQARVAAQDEFRFQDAKNFVESEYKDLLSNDYLRRLFFLEENRRRAPRERGGEADTRPYKELYKAIGDDLRKAFNLPKQASSSPTSPTPPGTVAARQARKAEAPPVPRTAAARLREAETAGKVPSPSEIIASMAATRGKNQLNPIRKGT